MMDSDPTHMLANSNTQAGETSHPANPAPAEHFLNMGLWCSTLAPWPQFCKIYTIIYLTFFIKWTLSQMTFFLA